MTTATLQSQKSSVCVLARRAAPPPARAGIAVGIALAIAAGGLHAVGWVLPGAWWAVWIAQSIAITVSAISPPKRALGLGLLIGAIGIACSFHWGYAALTHSFETSPFVAGALFLVLVAVEALGFGLFCLGTSFAARGGVRWLWLVPFTCVALEHWYPRIFPWQIGYSQLEVLPLIQIAELVGPTGIGFVLTAVAAIPTALVLGLGQSRQLTERRWAAVYVVVATLLLAATLVFGQLRIAQWSKWLPTQPKLKVGLVQVDPDFVGSQEKLRERSLAIHQQIDLLCWPESSLGIYSEGLTHFRDVTQTARLSRDSHDCLEPAKGFACHLLAGGKLYRNGIVGAGPVAMTAFLISPAQNVLGRYRKRTLLPFGEYIPGDRWFPSLRNWATLDHLLEAGTDPGPLVTSAGHKLGLVICYEDTHPRNARTTVAAGAEAIFSLIQGNAFENRLTLIQHQRLAALRAVENRRYFVRCASTGVTCVIDPTGQTIAWLPLQTEGTLLAEISPLSSPTLFNRLGDFFPIFCTVVSLAILVKFWRNRRGVLRGFSAKSSHIRLLGDTHNSSPN